MYTIQVHIANSEPVRLDVEELPSPLDNCVIGKNPRLTSEREVSWVDDGVQMIVVPMWRVNFIQVVTSGEDALDFTLPYRD